MFKKMDKVVIDVFKDWSIRLANHTQRPDVREKMHLSYRQHWRHQQRSVSLTTENQVSRLLLSEIRWLWHRQGTSGCIKHRNSINIGERSIVMTVSVCLCLSVREHISGNARPIFTKFLCMFAMYGRGSVLLWRCRHTLCTSGFADDVILVLKPRQLNVADQLTEAQPTCSRWLGYKRRAGITRCGQMDSQSRAYFSGSRSRPTRPQWACWIFLTSS